MTENSTEPYRIRREKPALQSYVAVRPKVRKQQFLSMEWCFLLTFFSIGEGIALYHPFPAPSFVLSNDAGWRKALTGFTYSLIDFFYKNFIPSGLK